MWKCGKCGDQINDNFDSCWKCANGGVEIVPGDEADIRIVSGVALATTPTLPGSRLVRSLGVACGEAIIGANIVSDMIAGVPIIIGGRSGTYDSTFKTARLIALNEMAQEAKERGGNAVSEWTLITRPSGAPCSSSAPPARRWAANQNRISNNGVHGSLASSPP